MRIWAAIRNRPGHSALAVACGVGALVCIPGDVAAQALVSTWIQEHGARPLLDAFRCFGAGEVAALVAILVAARGRRRLAAHVVMALLLAAAVTWILKVGVGRERPNGNAFSFVSGDTSTAFALVPLLAGRGLRAVGVFTVAALVALSRVALNYHYPVDVLAGAAVGLAAGVCAPCCVPERLRLGGHRLWLAVAGVAVAVAGIIAVFKAGQVRNFVLIWGPVALLLTLWPRLRVWRSASLPRWAPWAVAGAAGLLLLGLTTATTLMDRDEPRNALAAQEMVATGDWLIPSFNQEPRLHKPILPYWLMSACLRTGLPMDVACRLPAVLAMALAVALTALTAARLARHAGCDATRTATWTALVMATSPLALVSGSAATTDAVLLLGLSATVLLQVLAWLDGCRWWTVPALGAAIAWAILAKGPMGVLVPLVVAIGIAFQAPARAFWWAMAGGLVLGLALAAAWFFPANARLDGELWRVMILDHVVGRMMASRESHGGPIIYYLPVLAAMLLAWLPLMAVTHRHLMPAPLRWLLLIWPGLVLVVISLAKTKLPHYLLPALPGCAMLIAGCVVAAARVPAWAASVSGGLLAVLGLALVGGAPIAGWLQAAGVLVIPVPLAALLAPALAAGLVLTVLGVGMARLRQAVPLGRLAVLGMLALVLALVANAHRLEVYKPAPRIAAEIRARIPAGMPISTCGFDEPSLYAYLGPAHGPITTMHSADDLRAWAAADGQGVCVAERRKLDQAGELPVAQLARFAGYNYSNGKAVEVVLLGRNLPAQMRVSVAGPASR